jgi:MFS family permease
VTAYGTYMTSTQLPWLTYAPVTDEARAAFGVSAGAVGDLAVVVPLFYVLLGIPSGRWLDRWYRPTLIVGVVLSGAGATIRAIEPRSYTYALAGQVVLALGQPLVSNAITKLPARHFTSTRRTAAVSFVSAAQFLGILGASASGAWLVDRGGIDLLVHTHAVIVLVTCAFLLASLTIPEGVAAEPRVTSSRGAVRANPEVLLLAAQLFIGFGLFNAFATWIDRIQSEFGSPGLGGRLVSVITIGGILGAITLPPLAARLQRRRQLFIAIGVVNVAAVVSMVFVRAPVVLVGITAIMGFLLMAGMPAALDYSEELAGRDNAGAVAGFLMVVGNLGATAFVLAVQGLLFDPVAALLVLTLLVAPWPIVASRHPVDAPARRAGVLA